MNFVWNMTKQQWKDLYHDINRKSIMKDDEKISKSAGFYGNCYVGTLSADIQHTLTDGDYYAFVNVFEMGKDTGYATTKLGVPYSLLNDSPKVPVDAVTFEMFKKKFEKNFKNYIEKYNLLEQANAPLANWQ